MGSGITTHSWGSIKEAGVDYDFDLFISFEFNKNSFFVPAGDLVCEVTDAAWPGIIGSIDVQTGTISFIGDLHDGAFPLGKVLKTLFYNQAAIRLDYITVYFAGRESSHIRYPRVGHFQMNPEIPATIDDFEDMDWDGGSGSRYFPADSPARLGPMDVEIGNKGMYAFITDIGDTAFGDVDLDLRGFKIEFSIIKG